MKRLWFIFLIFMILICSTSCYSSSLKKKYDTHRSEKEILEIVDNETPYDKLITQEYDINDIVEKYFMPCEKWNTALNIPISNIDVGLPIECLRQNKAGNYYTVYKIKQGGLLYIFYSPKIRDVFMPEQKIERWFYINKPLSYTDFSSIVENSSWDEIKKIDPGAQIYENMSNTRTGESIVGSLHYMTDGILKISYIFSNDSKNIEDSIVLNKEYWEDYMTEYEYAVYVPPYDASILPIDMLKK